MLGFGEGLMINPSPTINLGGKMFNILIFWLVFISLVGAIFERGWKRILLVVFALVIIEGNYLPTGIWSAIIIFLTMVVGLIIDKIGRKKK